MDNIDTSNDDVIENKYNSLTTENEYEDLTIENITDLDYSVIFNYDLKNEIELVKIVKHINKKYMQCFNDRNKIISIIVYEIILNVVKPLKLIDRLDAIISYSEIFSRIIEKLYLNNKIEHIYDNYWLLRYVGSSTSYDILLSKDQIFDLLNYLVVNLTDETYFIEYSNGSNSECRYRDDL
jgi:hypothetical protein